MGTPGAVGRVDWVDVLRGLGILLVVAGHVTTSLGVHHVIFLFHMPLFFFLSGMMFRGGSMWETAVHRARTLLIPYVAFVVLVVLLDLLAYAIDGMPTLPYWPAWKFAAKLVSGGSILGGALTITWFVPCLYFTSVLFAGASRRFGDSLKPAMIAVAAAALDLAYLWPLMETPLGIGQVPFAFVFFWAGAVYKGLCLPTWAGWAALLAFLLSIPWAPAVDMNFMLFGMPLLSVAVALCGILGLIALAKVADLVPPLRKSLISLGQGALVIMFLHVVLKDHLSPYLPEALLFGVAVALPYLAYLAMLRFNWTRVVFLGQRPSS